MVTDSSHGSHQVWAEIDAGHYERAVSLLCSTPPGTAGDVGFEEGNIARICEASSDADALYEFGAALWGLDGNELLAVDVFRRAAGAGSKSAVAALGDALQWFGDDENALDWLERAVLDPETDSSWLHGLLGEALHLVAAGTFGAAIRLGNLLQDHMGDIDGAKRAYRTGMEMGDAHSAYNLGLLYWTEGDGAGARDAFAHARVLGDLTPPPHEQG